MLLNDQNGGRPTSRHSIKAQSVKSMPTSLAIYTNGVHMSDQLRIGAIEAGGTKNGL